MPAYTGSSRRTWGGTDLSGHSSGPAHTFFVVTSTSPPEAWCACAPKNVVRGTTSQAAIEALAAGHRPGPLVTEALRYPLFLSEKLFNVHDFDRIDETLKSAFGCVPPPSAARSGLYRSIRRGVTWSVWTIRCETWTEVCETKAAAKVIGLAHWDRVHQPLI